MKGEGICLNLVWAHSYGDRTFQKKTRPIIDKAKELGFKVINIVIAHILKSFLQRR